ncbi:uncharacterized protein TRAVEDRAFT_26084 [Trametes versicolor FP-101664 SS1]|uniref:uncharacterized protein n=1 Tax=Trametes versicolor (strain FP-101664) TaxID=717944 RepID=UPI00046230D8|nr:uncharacterized protein TRAVEDRAFT_26084 [Trametes versicolor FP-101664 SS1]EIW65193.1 hypothetical protein TRAVEDRAFT_26084 [Trametes versicolor FP-101664 SS1]
MAHARSLAMLSARCPCSVRAAHASPPPAPRVRVRCPRTIAPRRPHAYASLTSVSSARHRALRAEQPRGTRMGGQPH